jgi:N-methylhydantoinase A
MGHILGSDIGGTFTDFALLDESSGEIRIHKRLTTPSDPSAAVAAGIAAFDAQRLRDVGTHVHGTTLVINAVIERKGARTGLITTSGFRDVLAIGREKRYDAYDLRISFPEPLVPRQRRMEIRERLHASGRVLEALDAASVRAALSALLEQGIESLAVSLLHAYRNPAHELAVRAIVAEMAPDLPVSLSSRVLPEINEFERTSTTVVNAYTQPITRRYVDRLAERQREAGIGGELFLMRSSGGVTSAAVAREFPVQVIESGPAAGALGAAHYARLAGLDRVLAFDMGGTTAKLCLVKDGRVERTTEFEVARVHRFRKGSGLPVRVPVVDLMEIGAGGGSIARVSQVGTLQVGPASAGADPGPACYGQGGTLPTVTDADLLLGYLDAEHFLGGDMALDRAAAEAAVNTHLAQPLALALSTAAAGVHAIVNENMASAAKVYVTEHGEDPAGYTLVAFGGAGPVHAYDLARRLGLSRLLVPPRAGVASAVGMIVAPISYDSVRTCRVPLAGADLAALDALFAQMGDECIERMPRVDTAAQVSNERSADMRYVGQGYAVSVPLPDDALAALGEAGLRACFDAVYLRLYGRTYDELQLEVLNLRLTAIAPGASQVTVSHHGGSTHAQPVAERPAWCPLAQGFVPHRVYRRDALGAGFAADGPAIIEENESTTIAGSGSRVSVDGSGSLLVTLPGGRS